MNQTVDALYEIVYEWLNEFFDEVQPWEEEGDIRPTVATAVLKQRFEDLLKTSHVE